MNTPDNVNELTAYIGGKEFDIARDMYNYVYSIQTSILECVLLDYQYALVRTPETIYTLLHSTLNLYLLLTRYLDGDTNTENVLKVNGKFDYLLTQLYATRMTHISADYMSHTTTVNGKYVTITVTVTNTQE